MAIVPLFLKQHKKDRLVYFLYQGDHDEQRWIVDMQPFGMLCCYYLLCHSLYTSPVFLRGDFLESRVFFAKTAQNLATKPSRKNVLPPFSVLKVFQKYLRRKTEFYWIFGYVMRQNIAKYKEG